MDWPVTLIIVKDERGQYIIDSNLALTWGIGDTIPEAFEDYRVSLRELYKVLSDDRKLGEQLQIRLAKLEEFLPAW